MTENFYLYGKDTSSYFSGRIYESDFNGHTSLTDMAARIASDWRFDSTCRLQAEIRDRKRKYQQCLADGNV